LRCLLRRTGSLRGPIPWPKRLPETPVNRTFRPPSCDRSHELNRVMSSTGPGAGQLLSPHFTGGI
jgi:hypothetical protein